MDRIVVKPLEDTETMHGGLFIPDTAKEKPQQGEIIAVGTGRFEEGKRVMKRPIASGARLRESAPY